MIRGSCLCGTVTWGTDGPISFMSHCHCSRCRKAHGAAFATYVHMEAATVRLTGEEAIASTEGGRRFCRRCGSVVPYGSGALLFAPSGNFDDDPGIRPEAHIFVGSRAPWYQITDAVPRFDGYPPGYDAPTMPDRPPLDPPGHPRGSCLCGGVSFVVEGRALKRRYCHCSRCRKALSAAHATNMTVPVEGVRFTRGEELLARYKVPDARHFTAVFCSRCGSPAPRLDAERRIAIIPLGALDDDPGAPPPQSHIFVGSKAPWFEITDDLPRHQGYPPGE